jgi:hypothetical protein
VETVLSSAALDAWQIDGVKQQEAIRAQAQRGAARRAAFLHGGDGGFPDDAAPHKEDAGADDGGTGDGGQGGE